jgi:hypothetical protein
MYAFITAMSDEERAGYIARAAAYLKTEQAQPYSAQWFANTIAGAIYGSV